MGSVGRVSEFLQAGRAVARLERINAKCFRILFGEATGRGKYRLVLQLTSLVAWKCRVAGRKGFRS